MDPAAAEEFFTLVTQLQESRVYRALEDIWSGGDELSGDANKPLIVKSEDVSFDDAKEDQWLESVLTALGTDDLNKAQQFLLRFNDMLPSEQSDLIKIILAKIQTKISQNLQTEAMEELESDTSTVDSLIEIANTFISYKNFEKAHEILMKAMAVKETPKGLKLLNQVHQELQNQQNATSQLLMNYAKLAIKDYYYDIAKILLKATWIQYKYEPADKMLKAFFKNADPHCTKNIKSKTKEQLKDASEKYVKISKCLIYLGVI